MVQLLLYLTEALLEAITEERDNVFSRSQSVDEEPFYEGVVGFFCVQIRADSVTTCEFGGGHVSAQENIKH